MLKKCPRCIGGKILGESCLNCGCPKDNKVPGFLFNPDGSLKMTRQVQFERNIQHTEGIPMCNDHGNLRPAIRKPRRGLG